MTDAEYRKVMSAFVRELDRCAESEPFDSGQFHNIVEVMDHVTGLWLRNRRRLPSLSKYLFWFIAGVVFWVIMSTNC